MVGPPLLVGIDQGSFLHIRCKSKFHLKNNTKIHYCSKKIK